FFAPISITEIVPSQAFATHACVPSGVTSNPSDPPPTGITVSFQSPPGGPGGPPVPRAPGGGSPAPCQFGGGPPPAGRSVCSRLVPVAEFTLVVTIFFASGNT